METRYTYFVAKASGLVAGQSNLYGNVDSSGNVLQWNDLSGSNNHAIQAVAENAPQLRSHESIGLNKTKQDKIRKE